jgi:hypothetical protein
MNQANASKRKQSNCEGIRADGQPCKAKALPGKRFCWAHDETLAEKRDKARRQGGKNRANAARLRSLVPPRLVGVYDTLETAMAEVHDGRLVPGQATAMAALARAMVAVLQAGELEERLRSIENRVNSSGEH